MKISRQSKGKLNIVRAALSLGVAFALSICACLAWFNVNTSVGSSGSNFCTSLDSVKSVTVNCYKCPVDEDGNPIETDLPNTFALAGSNVSSVALDSYDMLSSSKTYRVLLEFICEGNLSQVSLSVKSSATDYIGAYVACDEQPSNLATARTLATPLTATGNSLSSVIAFYPLESDNVISTTYKGSTAFSVNLSGEEQPQKFAEPNVSGYTFNTDLTLLSGQQLTLAENQTLPQAKLYVMLDYNDDALFDIFAKNLTNTNIANTAYVQFDDCDFYFVVG
jgi:hypothetical protein